MAMEAQVVDAAFQEAFSKLENVRDSLVRLQKMIENQNNKCATIFEDDGEYYSRVR